MCYLALLPFSWRMYPTAANSEHFLPETLHSVLNHNVRPIKLQGRKIITRVSRDAETRGTSEHFTKERLEWQS